VQYDLSKFLIADELMREIMGALAHGHAELVAKSRSPLGTLAVKQAQLTVAFDLSVQGRESKDGLRLAVRPAPMFGLQFEQQSQQSASRLDVSNRATITLDIVNVMPPLRDDGPADGDPAATRRRVDEALRSVQAFIASLSPRVGALLADKIARILDLIDDSSIDAARALVAALLADLAGIEAEVTLPPEVEAALATLRALAGDTTPNADPIAPAAKRAAQALASELEAMNLPVAATRIRQPVERALARGRIGALRLVLAHRMNELLPELTGKVLPKSVIDALAALNLLDALDTGDGQWKQQLEPSLQQLRALVGGLGLPARIASAFNAGCDAALASRSAVEAGSRMVFVLDDLRRATAKLKLPEEVRAALDRLGQAGKGQDEKPRKRQG
jgi:hypothetical protein